MHTKSLRLCLTLCDAMDCSPSGFSVHGILQATILERVAMPSSRRSSQPRDRTQISCMGRQVFSTKPPGKPHLYLYLSMCTNACQNVRIYKETFMCLGLYKYTYVCKYTHLCMCLYLYIWCVCVCLSVQFSHSVVSDYTHTFILFSETFSVCF